MSVTKLDYVEPKLIITHSHLNDVLLTYYCWIFTQFLGTLYAVQQIIKNCQLISYRDVPMVHL